MGLFTPWKNKKQCTYSIFLFVIVWSGATPLGCGSDPYHPCSARGNARLGDLGSGGVVSGSIVYIVFLLI